MLILIFGMLLYIGYSYGYGVDVVFGGSVGFDLGFVVDVGSCIGF